MILFVAVFLGIALAIPVFFFFYAPANCSDGKTNGGERDVDCGGPCERICKNDALPPNLLWARPLQISKNSFSAVAYLENPSLSMEALNVPYVLKLKDGENLLIFEKRGKTYIPPGKTFAVFEGVMPVGERIPARAYFEFEGDIPWRKIESSPNELKVENKKISMDADGKTRLSFRLKNEELAAVYNIEAIGILFGENKNSIAASQTIVDFIPRNSSEEVMLSWPFKLSEKAVRSEVVYKIIPK